MRPSVLASATNRGPPRHIHILISNLAKSKLINLISSSIVANLDLLDLLLS